MGAELQPLADFRRKSSRSSTMVNKVIRMSHITFWLPDPRVSWDRGAEEQHISMTVFLHSSPVTRLWPYNGNAIPNKAKNQEIQSNVQRPKEQSCTTTFAWNNMNNTDKGVLQSSNLY